MGTLELDSPSTVRHHNERVTSTLCILTGQEFRRKNRKLAQKPRIKNKKL